MKKQFLILATTITTVAFISCSKGKIETNETSNNEEIATKPGGGGGNYSGNLNKGLICWYRFDGNLVEATGKLAAAVTGPVEGADVYTEDRKGFVNSAIQFNGRYIAYINNVPHSSKMSMAAWVKYDDASAPASVFISSQSDGPHFMQVSDQYYGYNNPVGSPYIASGPIDAHWHYLAATIDGTFLKFYVDGNLIGNVASPDVELDGLYYYVIGYGNAIPYYWHGAVDDVRIYSRTLSASEIQSLYNL